MGATSFFTRATGNSPTGAYNEAVREALYERGHGGYTGTIAEKSGYALFNIPLAEMPTREISQRQWTKDAGYASVMVAMPLEDRLATAIYWYSEHRWDCDDPFATKPAGDPDWMERYEWSEEQREEWRANQLANRNDAHFLATKMGRHNWEHLCDVFNDKWGPAVAVKTGDSEWLFFGMASC